MENENIKKVVHDAKLLITTLNKNNINLKGLIFDTAIAAYLIDSSKGEYKLSTLVKDYLGIEESSENFEEKCSAYIKNLYDVLNKKIKENNMEKLFNEIEMPLIYVLSSMESEGFKVNKKALDELEIKFTEEINSKKKLIYELADE